MAFTNYLRLVCVLGFACLLASCQSGSKVASLELAVERNRDQLHRLESNQEGLDTELEEIESMLKSLEESIKGLQERLTDVQADLEASQKFANQNPSTFTGESIFEESLPAEELTTDISAETATRETWVERQSAREEIAPTIPPAESQAQPDEIPESNERQIVSIIEPMTEESEQPHTSTSETSQPEGNYEGAYSQAFRAFSHGNYEEAALQFDQFLKQFPGNDLCDNARYWIGESYYLRGEHERAVQEWKQLINEYPDGDKVPDALLMTGLSLAKTGKAEESQEALADVVARFPKSRAADRARGELARAREETTQ